MKKRYIAATTLVTLFFALLHADRGNGIFSYIDAWQVSVAYQHYIGKIFGDMRITAVALVAVVTALPFYLVKRKVAYRQDGGAVSGIIGSMLLVISVASSFLILALHNDDGNGLITHLVGDWLYSTYSFYMEPVYSKMHEYAYLVMMSMLITFSPILIARAFKK